MYLAVRLAVILAIFGGSSAFAQQPSVKATQMRSATKVRNIGGFALGMHVRDAAKLSRMTDIGSGQFETSRDGVAYNFSVTDAGRIYRIESVQVLGRFAVDDAFLSTIADKLIAKYGPSQGTGSGTFGWELIEPVKRVGGATLPFTTNWASASISASAGEVSLTIKMIDFRLL